jgi:thioesterase domain-containing protein
MLDKAVEGNPVMARCLKCKKRIGAAFSPYLAIQGQWQKTIKQITITKIFSAHMSLISAKPHQSLPSE